MERTVIRHDERSYWSAGYLCCSRCNWKKPDKRGIIRRWRWHMFKKHRGVSWG